MKDILILTDFSANAANAAIAGAFLAERLKAGVLLYNACPAQAVAPLYDGGPALIDEVGFMEDESREQLKRFSETVRGFLEETAGEKPPRVKYEEGIGTLAYGVEGLIGRKNIELIVMGAREGSRFDHFLSGSATFSVIDHSARPVLLVPPRADFRKLRKVYFATNFAEADLKAFHYLVKLGTHLTYELQVIHINPMADRDLTKDLRKEQLMTHARSLKYTGLEITEVKGKNVVDRLNGLCDSSGEEMLAFTHYKDSFIARLLTGSTARMALEKQKAPVLIFPAAFLL